MFRAYPVYDGGKAREWQGEAWVGARGETSESEDGATLEKVTPGGKTILSPSFWSS